MIKKLSCLSLAAAGLLAAQVNSFQQSGWTKFPGPDVLMHQSPLEAQSGPVTGKPFSADENRRTTQTLADGTRVEHSDVSRFYRDDRGRMRSESPNKAIIYDPVASFVFTLDLKNRTYEKSAAFANHTTSIAASGYRTSISSWSGTRTHQGDWRTEDLPQQMMNGVNVKGTRLTTTIPAGAFGNDRDVKIVNERWTSDDLKVLVKSWNSDPRYGVTTYELTNIIQSPPDPGLFAVPPDFKEAAHNQHAMPLHH